MLAHGEAGELGGNSIQRYRSPGIRCAIADGMGPDQAGVIQRPHVEKSGGNVSQICVRIMQRTINIQAGGGIPLSPIGAAEILVGTGFVILIAIFRFEHERIRCGIGVLAHRRKMLVWIVPSRSITGKNGAAFRNVIEAFFLYELGADGGGL